MDDPLFAEIKDEIKEEEPWGDHSQEVQAQGVNGGHYDQETEEKPNVDDLDKHYIGWNLPNKEPSGAVNSPAMQMAARATDLEQPKEYRIVYVNRQVIRKAMKRSFPGEAGGEGNLPNGKDKFSSWKKAAGAQKADDIMRETEAVVKMEECDEENKKPPSSEEPYVGALRFTYKCPKCKVGFHTSSALHSHVIENHPGMSPLWCPLCPKKYKQPTSFWSHLKDAHGLSPPQDHPAGYKCDECGGYFRLREFYAYHCQAFRGIPHFYCQPCSMGFYGAEMEMHIQKHRNFQNQGRGTELQEQSGTESVVGDLPFTFTCPECEAGFHTSQFLLSHVKEKHLGTEPLSCHLCASTFRREDSYWAHLEEIHGVAQPKDHPGGYFCDQCGGHFLLRHQYALHCQLFRGSPHFYCQPCGRAVLNAYRDMHFEKHRNLRNGERRFQRNLEYGTYCHLCKEHVDPCDLDRHPMTPKHIAALRPLEYICMECGKSGMDEKNYEKHREGLKEKPHAFCEPCGMVLNSEEWKNHQLAMGHAGRVKARFYCCDLIVRPEEWEEHQMMKCHRESTWAEKVPLVWKCPVENCGVPFPTANGLTLHMALHPGVLPFHCRHCPKQFSHRPSRYAHEEMAHP